MRQAFFGVIFPFSGIILVDFIRKPNMIDFSFE